MTSSWTEAEASPSSGLPQLERTLEEIAGHDGLVTVSLPAPEADPLSLWPEHEHGPALLWQDDDVTAAGLGGALALSGSGSNRFQKIQSEAQALFSGLERVNLGREAAPEPRLYGGFSFRSDEPADDAWQGFGEARFVLPRLSYLVHDGRGWLALTVSGKEARDGTSRARWVGAVAQAQHALGQNDLPKAQPSAAPQRIQDLPLEPWAQKVQSAVSAIRHGQLQKVVLARRTELEFRRPISVPATLAQLSLGYPATHRFAFRFGGKTFLGSTPERLIRKRGLEIQSEAVAGSIRAGDSPQIEKLLGNPKERLEHQLVVDAIVAALSPLCGALRYSKGPEIRRLRHLLHLSTPISGRLKADHHVLDLVSRLHPTPAVGGVPTQEALDWIADREAHPRGWYAAPVGWFGASGDGMFDVALRSGLIEGSRALLYAGAGILGESNAESEYAETRLKLASLFHALRQS